MKERYDKSYIAIPLQESPLFDWAESLNTEKKFSHVTLFFLGSISETKLDKIKPIVSKAMEVLDGSELKPKKLAVLGKDYKSFVILIENTQKLKAAREILENSLPEFKSKNLPFVPHITIKSLSFYDLSAGTFDAFMESKDISSTISPYVPTSLGVYYRTEEDATALLYSKKPKQLAITSQGSAVKFF